MALTCNKQLLVPFSATFTVPNEFEYVDPTQFSLAISTENLIVYKTVVEQTIPVAPVVCNKTVEDLKVNIGQVNLSGSITFRLAANGLKTDTIVLDPSIPAPVPSVTFDPAWSSADGISSIKDTSTGANYVTIAYVPVDKEIVGKPIKVYLYSMELKHIGEDGQADDKTVTIGGEFKIVYDPIV